MNPIRWIKQTGIHTVKSILDANEEIVSEYRVRAVSGTSRMMKTNAGKLLFLFWRLCEKHLFRIDQMRWRRAKRAPAFFCESSFRFLPPMWSLSKALTSAEINFFDLFDLILCRIPGSGQYVQNPYGRFLYDLSRENDIPCVFLCRDSERNSAEAILCRTGLQGELLPWKGDKRAFLLHEMESRVLKNAAYIGSYLKPFPVKEGRRFFRMVYHSCDLFTERFRPDAGGSVSLARYDFWVSLHLAAGLETYPLAYEVGFWLGGPIWEYAGRCGTEAFFRIGKVYADADYARRLLALLHPAFSVSVPDKKAVAVLSAVQQARLGMEDYRKSGIPPTSEQDLKKILRHALCSRRRCKKLFLAIMEEYR